MKHLGAFSLRSDRGGVRPTDKSALLNTRYKDWWYIPGNRQHTIILELYEDNSICN